jgi:hypothetical protein
VPIAVFLVGALSAIASILANATQHGYYKNTRDQKRELENRLGLGDLAIATTRRMGGVRARLATVTTFQKFILVALMAADLTGFVAAIGHASRSAPATKVEVVAQVLVGQRHKPKNVPVVLSQKGRIMATASPGPAEMVALRVEPGRYQVAALAGKVCASTKTITAEPLQRLVIRCP